MTIKPFPTHKFEEKKIFQDDANAKVVLMQHRKTNTPYVIKIIQSCKVSEYVGGISIEAHIGMKLINNVGFAKTHKFYVTGPVHYLCIEYIEGMQLKELIEKHATEKMPVEQFRVLTSSYLQAMQYLVKERIFPRGLHDRNILIQPNGTVKIIDFAQYWGKRDRVSTIDVGHAIVNNLRLLFPSVNTEETPSFSSWEELISKHHESDGWEALGQWLEKAIDHPFMQGNLSE